MGPRRKLTKPLTLDELQARVAAKLHTRIEEVRAKVVPAAAIEGAAAITQAKRALLEGLDELLGGDEEDE